MANASLNDIKARIKSVSSTMQMTKAMELVATSKLRRAKDEALAARAFLATLDEAIADLSAGRDVRESIYIKEGTKKEKSGGTDREKSADGGSARSAQRSGEAAEKLGAKEEKNGEKITPKPEENAQNAKESAPHGRGGKLCIVIAGDRGLAGGYNSNVFKAAERHMTREDTVLPIGRKAAEYFSRRTERLYARLDSIAEADIGDAVRLGRRIAASFAAGEFSEVELIYTHFVSMLTTEVVVRGLLPLEAPEKQGDDPIYEGELDEILEKIIPMYVGGMLSSAIFEATASEQSSRRNAMSSANKNAKEIIDTLSISYNRARQAAITQEITEIISGAESQ